jgi:flagellar motor switch protein FliN
MKERTLTEAAADALGGVIGALLEADASVAASDEPIDPRWMIRLTFEGSLTGTLSVGMAAEDAASLARLVMGLEDTPPEAAVSDTLLELCSQGIAALGESHDFKGLRLAASQLLDAPPATASVTFRVTAGERFAGTLCLWDQSVIAARSREPIASAAGGVGSVMPPNLDVILDIDLPLSVRFGQTEMTLSELTQIGPGSVIDLGRSPDDPVDVLVHGRLVARGEVVVVSGNYGVRITDVISAADRLRTVAG